MAVHTRLVGEDGTIVPTLWNQAVEDGRPVGRCGVPACRSLAYGATIGPRLHGEHTFGVTCASGHEYGIPRGATPPTCAELHAVPDPGEPRHQQ